MSSQFSRVSDTGAQSGFSRFSSNKYISGTKEFLESNSIVAKFAFLLLVLLLFVLALRLGTSIMSWIFSPSPNPILINGMIDAKQMMRIPQDPSVNGAIPIMRSKGSDDGLVFTWSIWINIEDLQYRQNEYKHIFHKGNDDINVTNVPIGMNQPNNAPGLYIAPDTNDLVVVMNTFENINEEVIIKDIPLNKWVNVIIRVDEQHKLDVYINGRLVRRHILKSVPRQNYGDVYVSMNGGFSGYTSCLRYFGSAIGQNQIQSIVDKGPCLNMIGSNMTDAKPRYLSLRWFFAGNGDMYNPTQPMSA
jgi:hypothetical protein